MNIYGRAAETWQKMKTKKVLLFATLQFPSKTLLLQLRQQPLAHARGGGMRVGVPVCVCCSDINRFSFVVPFDSHSGWGRQINDDGNIYDIATATGGAYNEWVMQHTSSIDQRGSGAVGPAGTRHHRQSIRHAVPVAELLRSY